MTQSRRSVLVQTGSVLAASAGLASLATAQTYQYDPLGRLTRVTFSDGRFVVYSYDAAGNRTIVIHSDGSTFTATLQVTGTGPVNLRSIADAAGYANAQNVDITFQVGAAVTISGASGGGGVDTGVWPSDVLNVSLALEVSGKVYGGGGAGGLGAGSSPAPAAGNGGDAIYCRENIAITVNAGGQVKAGGGGGGGGASWVRTVSGEPYAFNGGGGGGGFPNGAGGDAGAGDQDVSQPGANGTASAGGAGGAGGAASPGGGTRVNGAGGAGGGAASAGAGGGNLSGSGGFGVWTSNTFAAGGQPGYAVRKNGKTVSVTNNGTIAGTVG